MTKGYMRNTLKICSIHKSATVLQSQLYHYINIKLEYEGIVFNRLAPKSSLSDVDLIIIRHPLNKLISQYYSFGWTHPAGEGGADFAKDREEIRSQTLDEYIIRPRHQHGLVRLYENAYLFPDKILRYESIMDNPREFILLILRRLEAEYLFDDVWQAWGAHFAFNSPDLSDSIINDDLITHRRNLDHDEYKKKLSPDTISSLSPAMADIIYKYEYESFSS